MSHTPSVVTRRTLIVRLAIAISVFFIAPIASAADAPVLAPAKPVFTHDNVLDIAKSLAQQAYSPPAPLPDSLAKLDYDSHRQIRFNKDKALWAGSKTKFSVEMFAPGSFFTNSVDLYVIENNAVTPAQIENDTFVTPNSNIAELLGMLDKIAGFRLHNAINTSKYQDEFLVFAGASYFRAVSKDQNYGLSARGLAIDVAEPTGEEFPIFKAFWIERPNARSSTVVIHALLDSKRVTGAYKFDVTPGNPTKMSVEATLFARSKLTHIGIGSLTSMFLFGGLDSSDIPDYRNAVHDSNGLAILNGMGEYIWRPLNNPQTLQVSAFVDKTPAGFGLIQRRRSLSDFEDLEANYHKRPSAWVTPKGDWGAGQVVLVEIPTRLETNDNIAAYWRPAQPLEAGTSFQFAYDLAFPNDSTLPKDFGRIYRTSTGLKFGTQVPEIVIDYKDLPANIDIKEVTFEASLSQGRVLETIPERNGANGMRAFILFDPNGAPMTEIRVQPRYKGQPIGETMLYRWLEK
jgi:periplasmic glucans biosynthesis protein